MKVRARPGGGTLKIKPFKCKPKLPSDFGETAWIKLRASVVAVHGKTAVPTSREELYQLANAMPGKNEGTAASLFEQLTAGTSVKSLGVQVAPNDEMIVTHVEPSGWAAGRGVRAGMKIEKLNGKACVPGNFTVEEIFDIVRNVRPLQVEVSRVQEWLKCHGGSGWLAVDGFTPQDQGANRTPSARNRKK